MLEAYVIVSIPAAAATAAVLDAWWWLLPLYLGYFAGLLILHAVITVALALLCGGERAPDKERPFLLFWLRQSARLVLRFVGVRAEITGLELLPEDGKYVIVSNHLSFYDPVIGVAMFPRQNFSYISKIENFEKPIVGHMMRACRHIPLDRENPRAAIRTIHRAAEMLESSGRPIAIFPEGTRSRSGHMLPFKAGAFHIAKKAKVPVVVSTIRGTELVKKNILRRSTRIQLDILTVIPAEEVDLLRPTELSDKVFGIMEEHLPERYRPLRREDAPQSEA